MNRVKPLLLCVSAVLGFTACGERVEGVRLDLGLAHVASSRGAVTEGPVRSFTRADGGHVTLTRGFVTLGSVELKPCEEGAGWRLLRALSPIGTAQAHSVASPRRLGTPHVSSLEAPDGAVLALGTLHPPAGRYCRARLGFEPADEDAEGLPSEDSGVDMLGRTLWLEGTVAPASGGASRPFHLESSNVATVEVVLDGLTLSEDSLQAGQVFSLAYDTWLDGVDLGSPDAAASALDSVARSVARSPLVP
jgi:hypothetical protein